MLAHSGQFSLHEPHMRPTTQMINIVTVSCGNFRQERLVRDHIARVVGWHHRHRHPIFILLLLLLIVFIIIFITIVTIILLLLLIVFIINILVLAMCLVLLRGILRGFLCVTKNILVVSSFQCFVQLIIFTKNSILPSSRNCRSLTFSSILFSNVCLCGRCERL